MRLALLLMLLAAPAACACTCIEWEMKGAFKEAEAVFLGEVVSYEGGIARMRPIERFKGAREEIVEFGAAEDGASCGYVAALTPGSRHLIYLYRWQGRLAASTCFRSRPESHAACDLRYLRSQAAWWRSPLSSVRILKWLGLARSKCMAG